MNRKLILVPRKPDSTIENAYGYIYITTNTCNNKHYIGQHCGDSLDKYYKGSGILLKKAFSKYGFDKFTVEPIDWAETKEELDQKEIYWIDFLGAVESNNWYNLALGGEGYGSGENHPLYGKPMPEYQRQRISDASPHISGENHPMYGTHINAGKSNPMYGKSGIDSPTYGRKHTEEEKLKMSKNHSDVSGGNNPFAKAIVKLTLNNEFIKEYGALKEAARFGGEESIRACCKHRKESYNGYHWMYKSEYEEMTKEAQD